MNGNNTNDTNLPQPAGENIEPEINKSYMEAAPEIQPDLKKEPAEPVVSRMSTKKKNRKKETIGWIISLSTAVVLALLLRFFVFEFILVDGPSMEPTLWTDEIVLVEKVSYHFSPPERFNVIVCFSPNKVTLVKRVIGLPGDKLEIKNGKLYINDKEIEEKYLGEPMDPDICDFDPVTVPDNTVFVMGDHRNVSQDSRDIGPIAYKDILGKTVFVVWPFDKIAVISGK